MKYGEGSTKFVIPGHCDLTEEKLKSIGRLITHQFLLTGTFPVILAKAFVVRLITGETEESLLIDSFLKTLTHSEESCICQALLPNTKFDADGLLDILSEFNITTLPHKNNLHKILTNIASFQLFTKPQGSIMGIYQVMGDFWANVTVEEVEALYAISEPSRDNILGNIDIEAKCSQDEKIGRWLVRYINDVDHETLEMFLRFTTSASFIDPTFKILVKFLFMSPEYTALIQNLSKDLLSCQKLFNLSSAKS